MKKSYILKYLCLTGAAAVLVGVMWHRAHMSYSSYSMQNQASYDNTSDDGEESRISFPQSYAEQVSDKFAFQAKIMTGENFDADKLYDATVKCQIPDPDKWKSTMLLESIDQYEYEEQETIGSNGIPGMYYMWNDEDADYLFLDADSVIYWKQPEIICMNSLFHFMPYDPLYNLSAFRQSPELEGFSKEEAWSYVEQKLFRAGVDTQSLSCNDEISFVVNKNVLREQQKILEQSPYFEDDNISYDWGREEEGYYFYCYQGLNGLMIYPGSSPNEYANDFDVYPSVFVARNGIYEVRIPVWYDVQTTGRKINLCDFDMIVDTLTRHFGQYNTTTSLVVTQCCLVEYPVPINAEEYQLVPVWLCMAEEDMGENAANTLKHVLAINAENGEEMTGLGGVD